MIRIDVFSFFFLFVCLFVAETILTRVNQTFLPFQSPQIQIMEKELASIVEEDIDEKKIDELHVSSTSATFVLL